MVCGIDTVEESTECEEGKEDGTLGCVADDSAGATGGDDGWQCGPQWTAVEAIDGHAVGSGRQWTAMPTAMDSKIQHCTAVDSKGWQ